MAATDMIRGRQTAVRTLTNKSGGGVVLGDVVLIGDGTNDNAFTTVTAGATSGIYPSKRVGIAMETIASNAAGLVALEGYVPIVNTAGSVARDSFLYVSTVAKEALAHSVRAPGAFGQILATGTDPVAVIWGLPDQMGGDWDKVITKIADDTVTNSAVMANDSELFHVLGISEVWRFELDIIYRSDATGDFKCDLRLGSGTADFTYRYLGSDTTAGAILVSTGIREVGVAGFATPISAGGGTATVNRTLLLEGYVKELSAGATLRYRFAQNTQTAGQSAITKAGSKLKLKRLA